jgi:apolipoprotein N-acyltransferase
VLQKSNLFQSAVMSEELRFITDRTIYSRIGDVAGWLSVAFTIAALVAARGRIR